MCEMLLVAADEPFRLDALWDVVGGMERYGVAGFGWGVAWTTGTGRLDAYRSTCAFRDDAARESIGARESRAVLVHLRRPSRLGTIGLRDAQPFVDGRQRFAFAHNGEYERHHPVREELLARGRIHGRADSEVAARLLEDAWEYVGAGAALEGVHEALGGLANQMTLEPSGRATAYAGNRENPLFSFRLGAWHVVSTALYSLDRSLFRLVAPAARARRIVRVGTSVGLGGA